MIKIGLAATNDAAGLDNKNVSAFIELAQKNDCEVIKGESAFFEPEEAKRVANGLKDCDLIVVTVKGFTWFGECINEFTKLGVPVCCWAVPEPKKEGVLLFNSMTGLNLFTSVANSGREIPAVKWLYGNADDTLFVNRFLTTLGAIRCLKAIKGKKIAIAGGVAEGQKNGDVREDIDPAFAAFMLDNLFMSLQFSYSCDYYRERFKIYVGNDIESRDEFVVEQSLKFIKSAFKNKS